MDICTMPWTRIQKMQRIYVSVIRGQEQVHASPNHIPEVWIKVHFSPVVGSRVQGLKVTEALFCQCFKQRQQYESNCLVSSVLNNHILCILFFISMATHLGMNVYFILMYGSESPCSVVYACDVSNVQPDYINPTCSDSDYRQEGVGLFNTQWTCPPSPLLSFPVVCK